jgi:acyl-CoA thioester hydrolase
MTKRGLGHAGARCTVPIQVRYAECDPMGYLHHAKYWEYFEVARTALLEEQGFRYRDLEAEGLLFVVYKAACTYLRPIRYDDRLEVTTQTVRVTRTRVDHEYEIRLAGEVTCRATTTLACVGTDGRPILMPDKLWGDAPE